MRREYGRNNAECVFVVQYRNHAIQRGNILTTSLVQTFINALERDDLTAVSDILDHDPGFKTRINDGLCAWNKPPLAASRSLKMAELLIGYGASPARVGTWWAPGFGTDEVQPEVAEYLMGLGAEETVHALSGLGLAARLSDMLKKHARAVHKKGGDGCRPLHFARTVEVARILADAGAELDARDDDHNSTPAQWRIGSPEGVSSFLLERGANSDIFLAAALGDEDGTRKIIETDPACTGYRIGSDKGPFPAHSLKAPGGSIYQWTLGFNRMPHEIAFERGHRQVFELLMGHSHATTRLLVACAIADRELADSVVRDNPQILRDLEGEDHTLLAKWCWETNQNVGGVRLMLDLGFPVDVPERNHGYSPLHNAAWCGNAELVELLLLHKHPVDTKDPHYHSTPLGWAIHSCVTAKRHPAERFPPVVDLLLGAGASYDMKDYPTGNDAIDAQLRQRFA